MVKFTEHVKVFCDGGSRGNPGPAASGVVITTTNDEVIGEYNEYLGLRTNNYAEYSAVILGLRELKDHKTVTRADFYLDSELVTKQLNGQYRVKHIDMKPLYARVQVLLGEVEAEVNFAHVRREFNTLADAQVNICLDAHIR
jgi:ribonuclease HI